jgi:prepilin-type N-terminal cleavage/methylation domain-containing protein
MRNEQKYKSLQGFTIVELLIVIVVIGVLAAIIIVAYNGVQARASATAVESQVEQYRNGLIQYATVNGAYPREAESFCLGAVDNYPDGCYAGSTTDSATEAKLRTVLSSLPLVDASCKQMGSETCRRNMPFIYQSGALLDGVSHSYYIMYFLDQAQDCKLSGNVGGTWENYTSTPNASGYFERDSSTGVTMCAVSLPDPSQL